MKFFALLLLSWACVQAQTDPFDLQSKGTGDTGGFRVWTSSIGTVVKAKLVEVKGAHVSLQTEAGKVFEVEIAALSQIDQNHLKTLASPAAPATTPRPSPPPAADTPLPMPRSVASTPRTTSSPETPSNRTAARRIPSDEAIDKIPLLLRKKTQPIQFSFYDMVRKKTVTTSDFKGKFVYVHTLYFQEQMGSQLTQLKLLHEKYGSSGFEIISIHPYSSRNNPGYDSSYEDGAVRRHIARAIEDYGIKWYISYPQKTGSNPLVSKFADQNYFDWLLDDQTRLIHANIHTGSTVYMSSDMQTVRLPLTDALNMIFPGVK